MSAPQNRSADLQSAVSLRTRHPKLCLVRDKVSGDASYLQNCPPSVPIRSGLRRTGILRGVTSSDAFEKSVRPAEFNSAIRQITNLRYESARRPRHLPWMRQRATAIFRRLLAVGFIVGLAMSSYGSILDFKQISIDFTNLATATNEVTWSPSDKLTVTHDGFGWDGEAQSVREAWIQTEPLALGLSWRPHYAVSVRVAILPPPTEISLNNGQKFTPYGGDVYVRYSPDRKHWSSWQALQSTEAQFPEEKKTPGRYFSGTVRVPYRIREHYG